MARAKNTRQETTPLRRSPRKRDSDADPKKMKKAKAAPEPELGPIAWSADEGALIWALLEQMQLKDNRFVLFGKTAAPLSKTAVFKQIGEKMLPESYAKAPNALGKRVKGKTEDLVKAYKRHAKKIHVTGGGLQKEDDDEEVDEFLECTIPADGPDHDTTPLAKNLWEQIKEFKYFPTIHKFLATCSNITPPAITTGVGPHGRKVIHLQPPTITKRDHSLDWDSNLVLEFRHYEPYEAR
ncbi:hypothetical protein MVEN_00908600 [Mycena venus]|uniref:Uncharacterized protein n=1 Tax=Mycena venus TaxID=2733690 RepID=A0A8H6YD10_9AGAR|nr:hypothetical protein MVEN_00908600 [Mycena venus]